LGGAQSLDLEAQSLDLEAQNLDLEAQNLDLEAYRGVLHPFARVEHPSLLPWLPNRVVPASLGGRSVGEDTERALLKRQRTSR